jgi:hypothetical protein
VPASTSTPATPTRSGTPAVGSIPEATTPTIRAVSATSGGPSPTYHPPVATSYDEAIPRVKAGDTFEKLSQTYYGTDRYAQALQQYNRNHPLAQDSLKDGRLVPGESVIVPAAAKLEESYGSFIRAK